MLSIIEKQQRKIDLWHKRIAAFLNKNHQLPASVYNQPRRYVLAASVDVNNQQLYLAYYRLMTKGECQQNPDMKLTSLLSRAAYFDLDESHVFRAVSYDRSRGEVDYYLILKDGAEGFRQAATAVYSLSWWETFRIKPPQCWKPSH